MTPGDKFTVFYHLDGCTLQCGEPVDTWQQAKANRGNAFSKRRVRAAWIMRENPSLGARPERYGFTLRRSKYETA